MISYRLSMSPVDTRRIFPLVSNLDALYPDFSNWYWSKAVPGMTTGKDFMIIAEEHDQIVGVALAKRDDVESKLRCVRVRPEYVNRGVALHMIDRTLQALPTSKPVVTVAEEMLHNYARMFVNRYDFQLDDVQKHMYRQGKLEYLFNSKP